MDAKREAGEANEKVAQLQQDVMDAKQEAADADQRATAAIAQYSALSETLNGLVASTAFSLV